MTAPIVQDCGCDEVCMHGSNYCSSCEFYGHAYACPRNSLTRRPDAKPGEQSFPCCVHCNAPMRDIRACGAEHGHTIPCGQCPEESCIHCRTPKSQGQFHHGCGVCGTIYAYPSQVFEPTPVPEVCFLCHGSPNDYPPGSGCYCPACSGTLRS